MASVAQNDITVNLHSANNHQHSDNNNQVHFRNKVNFIRYQVDIIESTKKQYTETQMRKRHRCSLYALQTNANFHRSSKTFSEDDRHPEGVRRQVIKICIFRKSETSRPFFQSGHMAEVSTCRCSCRPPPHGPAMTSRDRQCNTHTHTIF